MKALITGITGFAGTHLAEHMLSRGDQVLGCCPSGEWRDDAPDALRNHTLLVSWDVRERMKGSIRDRIEACSPDCIFHLAAMSIPSECGKTEPTDDASHTNVIGTQNVLDLAGSLTKRPRVLLVSSCYVYAPVDLNQPVVHEDSPIGPTSGYGKTKLAAEQALLNAVREQQTDAVIARVFQHSGPRQSPRMIVPEWSRQFVRGDDPIQVQSLDAYLDLTDVRDTVRAYRSLIERGETGQTYNVGSGIARRSGEIFDLMRQLHDPQRRVVELAPGRRQNPIADISRITGRTNWRPEIPLEKTVQDTLLYWKHQPIES